MKIDKTQTVPQRIAAILDSIAAPLLDRWDALQTKKHGSAMLTTPTVRAASFALHIMPPPDGLRRRMKSDEGTPTDAPAIHAWSRFSEGRLHISIHPDSIVTGCVPQIAGSLLHELATFEAHGPEGPQPVPKIARDSAGNEVQTGTTVQKYTAAWRDAAVSLGLDVKAKGNRIQPEAVATAKLQAAISEARKDLVPYIGAKPKGQARAVYMVTLTPYKGKKALETLTDQHGKPFLVPVGEERAVELHAMMTAGLRFVLTPYVKAPGEEPVPMDEATDLLSAAVTNTARKEQQRAERKAKKAEKEKAAQQTATAPAPAPESDESDPNE